jgi:hypothetical protein
VEVFDPASTQGSFFHCVLSILYGTDRIEKTAPNSSAILDCIFVAAATSLLSRYLDMIVFSIPAFMNKGAHTYTDCKAIS